MGRREGDLYPCEEGRQLDAARNARYVWLTVAPSDATSVRLAFNSTRNRVSVITLFFDGYQYFFITTVYQFVIYAKKCSLTPEIIQTSTLFVKF